MKLFFKFVKQKSALLVRYFSKNRKLSLVVIAVVIIAAGGSYYFISQKKFEENKLDDLTDIRQLYSEGKTAEAISDLELRYKKDKNDKDTAGLLAQYYLTAKEFDKLEKVILDSKLTDSKYYTFLAYIYRVRNNNEKTIEYYQAAIKASAKSANNYVDLANYYQVQGQNDKALEVIKEGLNFVPKSSTLNLLAANLSLALGNKAAAKEYAAKVLETDQDNTRAKEILSKK